MQYAKLWAEKLDTISPRPTRTSTKAGRSEYTARRIAGSSPNSKCCHATYNLRFLCRAYQVWSRYTTGVLASRIATSIPIAALRRSDGEKSTLNARQVGHHAEHLCSSKAQMRQLSLQSGCEAVRRVVHMCILMHAEVAAGCRLYRLRGRPRSEQSDESASKILSVAAS